MGKGKVDGPLGSQLDLLDSIVHSRLNQGRLSPLHEPAKCLHSHWGKLQNTLSRLACCATSLLNLLDLLWTLRFCGNGEGGRVHLDPKEAGLCMAHFCEEGCD